MGREQEVSSCHLAVARDKEMGGCIGVEYANGEREITERTNRIGIKLIV